MPAFSKILVPVDGSPNSHRAVAYAGYLAKCCQASVGLLHITNISADIAAFSQASSGYVPDSVIADIQAAGQSIITEALSLLSPEIAAKGFVEVGAPTETVVKFCITNGYDLIIVGNRGLGTLEQLMFGSVSRYILHHAPCPVMVIR